MVLYLNNMITIGQERHLGSHAYFMMMSKRLIIALGFLFAAMIIVSAQGALVSSLRASSGAASAVSLNNGLNIVVGVLLITSIIIFFVGVLLAKIDYDNMSLTFDTYDLVIRSGLITKQESSYPYHHIQSVKIERSPIQQLFGTSRIIFVTNEKGSSGNSSEGTIVLEPVDKDLANDIRQTLESRMSVDIIEDRDKFIDPNQPTNQPLAKTTDAQPTA